MVDMHVAVILDRSGSMSGRTAAVIEHFNAYKEEVANLPEKVSMGIYQFDTVYEAISEALDVSLIPDLTASVYFARGGTALLDAIGRTISALDARVDLPSKVVIVINTDGAENSSKEFTHAQIKQLVTDHQTQRDWQFVFVGAGIDAFSIGSSYGFQGSSTYTTTNDSVGYDSSYNVLASATRSYSSGATATMDMATAASSLPIIDIDEEKKKKEKEESESR